MIAFYTWLNRQRERDDPTGDLARDTERIRCGGWKYSRYVHAPPPKSSEFLAWRNYLYCTHEAVRLALVEAFREYRRENPKKTSNVSGRGLSLRYKILRRDGFRCQACGASAEEGARLEIDHIFPRSRGGPTVPENLQVLCFDCNHGKRDSA